MPQLVLDSSGVIPGRHHWPPARLPDQGSLKEASWPSGDNLDCQPRLLAIPGLGHPRPLVIRRHPWPSRGNLGCQPWLVVTPDLGHPWSFGLQETSPAIGRQPWLPPLATSSTSRPGVTEGDILASARASTSLAHQPCSPALLQPCSSLAHQPCSPALLQPCSPALLQPCSSLAPALLTSLAHQCTCIQSTRTPVSVPAERVARRAQGRRWEGADLQHLGVTVRPSPNQGAAIKEIPPRMRGSPAVEVRTDPGTTTHSATGVAVLVLVNLSL